MEPATATWKHSVVYLSLILSVVYLIQCLIIPKFFIGNHPLHVKRTASDLPLHFRSESGTFKILQVADMHFGNGVTTRCRDVLPSEFEHCTDLNTTRFLRRMIQAEKPDFIAFTGDNIFGPSSTDAAESLFRVFSPAMESGVPWAAILGNHDHESTMTREELMSFTSLLDYSLSQINPPIEDASISSERDVMTDIDGYGNYNLEVYGAPGSILANSSILSLFFLDSGARVTVQGIRTYDWIKDSQLNWLRGRSRKFQENGHGLNHLANALSTDIVPALAFFHIPIPEIRQLYYTIVGQYQEGVACSTVNSGVLDTFVAMGDIKAVFMGHDHKNDFCGNLKDIWFCYGGGIGYHGYGRPGWPRRARVILAELAKGDRTWMGVERIRTWKRLDDEQLTKIDEQVLWNQWASG